VQDGPLLSVADAARTTRHGSVSRTRRPCQVHVNQLGEAVDKVCTVYEMSQVHTRSHLPRDWAHPCHIFPGTGRTSSPGTGPTPATSSPGLGAPLPHLHRDAPHSCHIRTGTGLTPATSAPRPVPHPHQDSAHPRRICTALLEHSCTCIGGCGRVVLALGSSHNGAKSE
jgi:hypothetical protein